MKNNKVWMSLFGAALATSITVIGCGSSGGGTFAGGGGTGTGGSGSGASGGSGTGTASVGLNGGSVTGSGGQNTGTSGTGTSTGGTSGTSGGTGTTTAGNTTGGFLGPVEDAGQVASLNQPTQMVRVGSRIYFVDGFGLANNGRLMYTTVDANNNFTTPVQITGATGSPVSSVLVNPWGLVSDGTNLYISVGFNSPQEAGILRVSNINATANTATFTELTGAATFMDNPAFMLLANVDGGQYIYWSEYSSVNSSGRVRRTLASGNGQGAIQDVVNNLNFPAGLATDGNNLVICDNAGGGTSLGRLVRVPLSFSNTNTTNADNATQITPIASQVSDPIVRPFDVAYDGLNGFFITEGNAINYPGSTTTLPQPNTQGGGRVRYLPRTATTATVVATGLSNTAGIDVAQLTNGSVGVLFSESIVSTGRVLRIVVDPTNVAVQTPSVVDTGLFSPIDVAIVDSARPLFLALVNYDGGQSNGLLNAYAP